MDEYEFARCGRLEQLKNILETKYVNGNQFKNWNKLLIQACLGDKLDNAKWILGKGADNQNQCLEIVCERNYFDLINEQKEEPNEQKKIQYEQEQLETAKWWVSNGANHFNWPLLNACKVGNFTIAKWAKENGAWNFDWPLFIACKYNQYEMAKWLINIGAKDLNSALGATYENGNLELAEWLVSLGGNNFDLALKIGQKNKDQKLIDWAKNKGGK